MNSNRKKRYFIECSYDGSRYNGWQTQPNGIGVQQVIESALKTLFRESIAITGSGRTDAGVHANQQIAHVDLMLTKDMSLETCRYKLNSILPSDIAIHSINEVNPNAHARFDAIRRTYKYYILFKKDPFLRRYHYYFKGQLYIQSMQAAAEIITAYQDFSSFCKSHAASQTPFCRVEKSEIVTSDDGIVYTVTSDRFLRNMVRAIVGTLIEIGKGDLSVEDMHRIIKEKDRKAAGFSAPAHGLFLYKVDYPDSIYDLHSPDDISD